MTVGQRVRIRECEHKSLGYFKQYAGHVFTIRYRWSKSEPAHIAKDHGVAWPDELWRYGLTDTETGLAAFDLLECQLEPV